MYAIIRTGGKQSKVHTGDIIDVERLRASDEITFTPLLVVDDSGRVFSGREQMKDAKVVARVVGEGAGPKIDIFKYKNKTGYRRRQGHRQKYTTIEVTDIVAPSGKAAAKKPAAKKAAPKADASPKAEKAEAKPAAAAKPKAEAKPKAAPKPEKIDAAAATAAAEKAAEMGQEAAAAEVAKRLAAPKGAEADDLKKIGGVGPVLEGKLNGLGITTFAQLANLSSDDIGLVSAALGSFPDRILRDDWVGQAKQFLDDMTKES